MSAQRARPLWPSTTWKVWMSSRTGLWLSSSRSVSPRVPTVEYARSERSSAKSSQAARNSRLVLRARSGGAAPAPGGVELEERELDERAVGHETKGNGAPSLAAGALVCGVCRSAGTPPPARRPCGAAARARRSASSRRVPAHGVGVMSTGIGNVPAEQTYLDISPGEPDRRHALRPAAAAAPRASIVARPALGADRRRGRRVPPPRSSPACWRRPCCPRGIRSRGGARRGIRGAARGRARRRRGRAARGGRSSVFSAGVGARAQAGDRHRRGTTS